MMIAKNSREWERLLKLLQRSKSKSNRDVLCAKCWKIYTYEGNVVHKLQQPDHAEEILTTKMYANEEKFVAAAKKLNKMKVEGERELYENPYYKEEHIERPRSLPKREDEEEKLGHGSRSREGRRNYSSNS